MAKPLKQENTLKLWLIVAVNVLVLFLLIQTGNLPGANLQGLLDKKNLLPPGIAVIVTTVLNGLLTSNAKSRLVFFRWHNVLPGHRAFTNYAKDDPRIDLASLEKLHGAALPTTPREQNQLWYRLYKTVEKKPSVVQVHGDFLLLRDYTGFAALFLIAFGFAAYVAVPSPKTVWSYIALLLAQFLVVRQAAATYGGRMVTTVLAEKAASVPHRTTTRTPTRRPRKRATGSDS